MALPAKSIIKSAPGQVTLDQLLGVIGGIHKERSVRKFIPVAEWMLSHGEFLRAGCAGAIYRLRLADADVAVKAGIIFIPEAWTQDAVANEIGMAPIVYSYMRDLDIAPAYHDELCPYHGPLRRRKGKWVKDLAPCHCRYGKDFLVMEYCERRVTPKEITPQIQQNLELLAKECFRIGERFRHSPEIKTVMWLDGRMVFVDFGDPVDMDDLKVKNPRYATDYMRYQV